MKRALFGILFALIMAGACIDAAYADFVDDFAVRRINLHQKEHSGTMIADWQGRAPLSEYEGRWIYYAVEDKSTGRGITFEFWPVVWVNASCEPPCTIQMDFILRNVNWITK